MSEEEITALTSGNVDLSSVEVEDKRAEAIEENGGGAVPPPPPPSEDSRMVEQLDDVTKDSEKKASEIFDSVEIINESLANIEEELSNEIKNSIQWNIEMFEKLTKQFPNISQFQEGLDKNKEVVKSLEEITDALYNNQDEIMVIMDKMQYQDIHRQKIERVINVMRSLALYMNHLFSSSSVKDEERVASAKHLAGDNTEDLVDQDNLEALIASFGN